MEKFAPPDLRGPSRSTPLGASKFHEIGIWRTAAAWRGVRDPLWWGRSKRVLPGCNRLSELKIKIPP